MDASQVKTSEKSADAPDDAAHDHSERTSTHPDRAEVPLPATNNAKPAAASAPAAAAQPVPNVGSPDINAAPGSSGGPPSGNPEEVVLFVSGFGYGLNDDGFAAMFSPYGKVISCKVLIDIPTGKSKGCGLIRLENKKAAEAAVTALNNTTLPGQVTSLTVKFADTPEEKSRRRARQLMQARFNPMARPGPMPFPMMGAPPMAFPSIAVPGAYGGAAATYGGAAAASTAAGGAAYPSYPAAAGTSAAAGSTGYQPSFQQLQAMTEASAYSTVPGQFTLYVGGLPQGVDEGTLYKMFSPYGAVAGVKIVMDAAQPTMHRGFAFVNFFRYEEACTAIYSLNSQQFGDKRLQVSFKTAPKTKGPMGAMSARTPGAATGGYTGPAAAGSYAGYQPAQYAAAASGYAQPYTQGSSAATTAQPYGTNAQYQQYPYGGSYQ